MRVSVMLSLAFAGDKAPSFAARGPQDLPMHPGSACLEAPPICGIITPRERGVIHADKRQRDYRYRVAFRAGLAGAAMWCEDTAGHRVSVLPTRRMAGADYMAGPALARRPKRD